MILLCAHKKWLKMETLKVNTGMGKVINSMEELKKLMTLVEAYRLRSMMFGFYIDQINDESRDDKEEGSGGALSKCAMVVSRGFNRRRLRDAQGQSGLKRLMNIQFKRV